MAVAITTTSAPARRLLRAAGPCRILTTADVLALRAEHSADDLPGEVGHDIGQREGTTRLVPLRSNACVASRARRPSAAPTRARLRA